MVQSKQKIPAVELTNDSNDTLRYSQHGLPSDLIRWHLHDDYELHLITATRGRFFVGDFIGTFEPGQLVLTGRFIEFLNRVRISRACTLLSATDLQITRICFEVGFNNVANFNRRFHELKGITPSEYRALANSQHRLID